MGIMLTRYRSGLTVLTLCLMMIGCVKNDMVVRTKELSINQPAGGFTVPRYKLLPLTMTVNNIENPSFEWKVNGTVVSTDRQFYFISSTEGEYEVTFSVKEAYGTISKTQKIFVTKELTPYSKNLNKVFEYFPAPGQFVHNLPAYVAGDTETQMAEKAEKSLKSGSMIHLGGFGGYVVMGFDHTILNVPGKPSFLVKGNAFVNSAEPGVVQVAIDANGNGLPDDEWYEIAGSEYNSPKTVKNYEITYYKPDENKVPTPNKDYAFLTDTTYIRWTDNQGGKGYLSKNSFHSQSYYPQWKGQSITFKGTKLTSDGIVDKSGSGTYFVSPAFEFGYVDNWANTDPRAAIQIDWAVDKKGNPVKLPGIDFIRIHTGIRAEAGWLGENSTEVSAVEDLNLK